MHSTDRPLRMRTLETLYGALEPLTPVLAHCYDSLVADRLVDDRLRGFDGPMAQRNLVERARERGRRGDDGGDRVALLDRAPLVPPQGRAARARPSCTWPTSTRRSASGARSPTTRRAPSSPARSRGSRATSSGLAHGFFDDRRVDAEPRQGKRGGAFCASVSQDSQAFIMLNYTDRLRDVMTMAHELGHGMHFTLSAQRQSALSFHPGIALAEVPSTFAELVTFDYMMENERMRPARALVPARSSSRASRRVPADDDGALRVRRVRRARRGPDADARPPLRDVAGAQPRASTATRSSCRRATASAGATSRTSSTPASTRTRTRSRTSRASCCTRVARGGRRVRAEVPGVPRPGRRGHRRPTQLGAFGIDLTSEATWHRGLDEMERLLELALAEQPRPAGRETCIC